MAWLAWALCLSSHVGNLHAEILVRGPEDGGWPRGVGKIAQHGPRDFTVDPDGHDRYLMVEIENNGISSEPVTLRGFLKNFGATTEIVDHRIVKTGPGNPYLYVQKGPDAAWERTAPVPGTATQTPQWTIDVPPGTTTVSTVVTFRYSDYQEYIDRLPDNDPRLKKEVVASSGEGQFKTYRIRITQPNGSRQKLRIALDKTSHAYEKAGFFIAQGAIEWLLSGDPAANLDRIEWSIYPCLDPQAAHDGCNYIEQADLVMDDGRIRGDARTLKGAIWDPQHGEIASQHYHVLTDVHMWEIQDCESYKYNDPFAPSGYAGNGISQIEHDLLAFWPCWYEFGIDHFDHENKWPGTPVVSVAGADKAVARNHNARPEDFGGALVTHLELPSYGKDDIDPVVRWREQGRLWARSHSQAYLRMQRDRNFWTASSPGGAVDTRGAVFLPVPEITLLENLEPVSGKPVENTVDDHQLPCLNHEDYAHAVVCAAGESLIYAIPNSANSFRAMVGIEDHHNRDALVTFTITLDGKNVWRSRELKQFERQLASVNIMEGKLITLSANGPMETLVVWGGGTFDRKRSRCS